MKKRIRLAQSHFRRTKPGAPVIKPIKQWAKANQGFYDGFRAWLRTGGYSESAVMLYSVAARLALGLLDKPYWMMEAGTDLETVHTYITERYASQGTRRTYNKGLRKLAEYLRLRNRQPQPEKPINWAYYCATLPNWLGDDVRAFLTHCRRNWLPAARRRRTLDLLSHLTLSLRWMVQHTPLPDATAITPDLWFDYVDARLAAGISPVTLNGQLHSLHHFLHYLNDQQRPICHRMLRVERLHVGPPLPRDVPLDQLQSLHARIELDAASSHTNQRRMGLMDRAWFLLMLHSGLRTGEVRRLQINQVDLKGQRLRIEQSKGLKDRLVCLSQATVEAIEAYLPLRGPARTDHLFLFRHQPLSVTYCLERLHTYGNRCNIKVTPHQLRFSCATLLLNAGAPILTVQTLLGHKFVDTTLTYARLYDGTIAADYYRAMSRVEQQLPLTGDSLPEPITPAHLLALVDSLRNGTLNEGQKETVQQLRDGILAMVETE